MKQPQDHVSRNGTRDVRLASITSSPGLATCSCGWEKRHPRAKVSEAAAQRHVDKKHDGRAIWA